MKNKNSLTYTITSYLVYPIFNLFIKTTIEGEHFIPIEGPVILVSNHISFADPLCLAYLARRRKRQISFMAKDSLFKNSLLGKFLSACQQIPVSRGTEKAKDSLLHAQEALKVDKCVAIYPEATISDTKKLLPIKSGAIRLAQDTGVEIVLVGTYGAHRLWTKGSRPKLRFRTKHAMVVAKGYKIEKNKDIEEARTEMFNKLTALALEAKKKLGG